MEGYYNTPNKMIPLNDREPGEIADIAWEQLEPYRIAAKTWPVYTDGRCNRCEECHQNIWFTTDLQRTAYTYDPEEIQALIVAHIRQCHDTGIGSNNRDNNANRDSDASRRIQ